MKRSASAAVRDPSRRAQRIGLLRHDVPAIKQDVSLSPAVSVSAAVSDADLRRIVDERLEGLLPGLVARKVNALRKEFAAATLDESDYESDDAFDDEDAAVDASSTTSGGGASAVLADASPAPKPAQPIVASARPVPSNAPAATDLPSSPTAPKVRVVTRNPISGAAALGHKDDAPSLARKASAQSTQPALAPRCFAHAGQHYLGATEDDAVAAWQAMRERFRLTPENKIVARRALLDWLQRTRTVCSSNIHWYGDFVAVRSCPVRLPEEHPGHGVDGWFILFDPNGESFLRAPLFAEAFDAPDARHSGVVPQLARPAWIAEERRASSAARHGSEQSRPFSPETADDLTANDFFRGLAE